MGIKEKAKAHFAARATHEIEIPEWGETVYYKTPNMQAYKVILAESNGNAIEMQARLVVQCATDANGQRIWQKQEYSDLMREYDPGIIARIANEIMAEAKLDAGPKEQAETEKN